MTAISKFDELPEKEKFHQTVLRTYRTNPLILIGTLAILILVTLASQRRWFAPNDPYDQHLDTRRLPPFTNPQFPLGTDEIGRCLLSRVIYGGRVSLGVGFLTSMLSALIGIPMGMIAGYSTSALSEFLGRVIDITLATPEILLALALAAILGRSLMIVMISVSLVWWANYARIVRGQVLQIKETDYVTAARTVGVSTFRILWRHIFP